MTTDKIARNMEVIGADGVRVGTVDTVVDGRIGSRARQRRRPAHNSSLRRPVAPPCLDCCR